MGKRIDLTGQRFGRLTVLNRALDRKSNAYYLCQCDCGVNKEVYGYNLTSGKTQSCGCYRNDRIRETHCKDMVGANHNRLLVLAPAHRNTRGQFWKCQCDCGNTPTILGSRLRSGHTKSCGCLRDQRIAALRQLPPGEAALNCLFGGYKQGAKERGYIFELSKKVFKRITQQACFYCGHLPTTVYQFRHCNGVYTYNGIDRVDNSKGYMEGNVVTCCKTCNRWKHADSQEEFLEQVKKIYEYSMKGKQR